MAIFRLASYWPHHRCSWFAEWPLRSSFLVSATPNNRLRQTAHLANWARALGARLRGARRVPRPEDTMGLLTFSINVTLDGCVDHQKGTADDETHAFFTRLMDEGGAML